MQAVLVKNQQLVIGEYPKPKPGPHEALIEVAAAGVNRADTLQRQGKYPPPRGASSLLGLEVAGTVVELGSKVRTLKKGDKVMGLLPGGGYAQYAVMAEGLALPVPAGMEFTEAAAIPEVFLTAWQALVWLAKLEEGETVLIHAGASGVGTATIQLAKAKGAQVIVTASKPKHKLCKQLGATYAIDYKTQNWAERVSYLTQGRGANVIIDFIAADYWQDNLQSLTTDGRLVMLALLGGHKIEGSLAPILQKRLSILGSTLRSRSVEYQSRLTEDLARFLLPKLEDGSIKPVIDTILPWQEVAEAHRKIEANGNAGKIVLDFNLTI
jgi:putative PIG3 family NAD(P)H quinone oxidoreductase